MIVLFFHRQRDNLTELLQIKFHHSSLILIGGIECVTIAPGLPYYNTEVQMIATICNKCINSRKSCYFNRVNRIYSYLYLV